MSAAKKKRARSIAVPAWVGPAAVGVLLFGVTVWAWPPRDELEPQVEKGNRAWDQREYPQALQHYEAAPGDGVRNAGVHMNRGIARFRLMAPPDDSGTLPELGPDAALPEGYERAQDEIRNTMRGMAGAPMEDIPSMSRARAAYNLGNTYFAEHSWRDAIDAYKEALRLRPGWIDAAWNLELARRRKDEEDHPDAGPDASQDASQDAANDGPPPDGSQGDGGSPGDGGSQQGDGGSPQNDGGSNSSPDGGSSSPDAGSPPQNDDAGTPPPQADGGAPPPPPMSLAPLDQLERNAQDLQQMLLRRRASQVPRNPDDER